MKANKIFMTTAGAVGATLLLYATKKTLDQKKCQQKQENMLAEVRQFFTQKAPIATVYVKLYQSTQECLIGGVIYEDGRHASFTYDKGKLTYEEDEG